MGKFYAIDPYLFQKSPFISAKARINFLELFKSGVNTCASSAFLKLEWAFESPGALPKMHISNSIYLGFCISHKLPSGSSSSGLWSLIKPSLIHSFLHRGIANNQGVRDTHDLTLLIQRHCHQ